MEHVRWSFARQGLLATLGATLEQAEPGRVQLALPFSAGLGDGRGALHPGAVAALLEAAAALAALTLLQPGTEVATVEFKINFLRPAEATHFLARATVLRPGRRFSVCIGDVAGVHGPRERNLATMLATVAVGGEGSGSGPVERG